MLIQQLEKAKPRHSRLAFGSLFIHCAQQGIAPFLFLSVIRSQTRSSRPSQRLWLVTLPLNAVESSTVLSIPYAASKERESKSASCSPGRGGRGRQFRCVASRVIGSSRLPA